MIVEIYTRDNNIFRLSNDEKDRGCPYDVDDYTLNIFVTNLENLYYDYKAGKFRYPFHIDNKTTYLYFNDDLDVFFNYKKASIIVPYTMIKNVKFTDWTGEDLYRFIWSKNHGGKLLEYPPIYSSTPDESLDYSYYFPIRDKRLVGCKVFNETLI
jgi:hypothetical protein